jgi:hypothetical protein
MKPNAEICRYDAEEVLELMNCHDQGLIFDHVFGIQKQSTFEEAEEPEPGPKKMATTVTNLTAGYDVTEGGVNVF